MSEIYIQKINKLIQREVSQILLYDMANPQLAGITVTEVRVNHEISVAKVFVQIPGDSKQQKEALKALMLATKKIKFQLGTRIKLKSVPDLVFKLDNSWEQVISLEKLFDKIKQERNAKHDIQ